MLEVSDDPRPTSRVGSLAQLEHQCVVRSYAVTHIESTQLPNNVGLRNDSLVCREYSAREVVPEFLVVVPWPFAKFIAMPIGETHCPEGPHR